MKLKIALAALAAAGLLAGTIAYADPDTDRDHPKAFVKDSVITTKIKSSGLAERQCSVPRGAGSGHRNCAQHRRRQGRAQLPHRGARLI